MSRQAGQMAERQAEAYLCEQGFRVLARNYTVRGAEVDLIAEEKGCVVFVEVKYRASGSYAMPREAVTRAKQRRIIMAAARWLQETGRQEAAVRFDVVEVMPAGITHLRAAFDATQAGAAW